MTHEKSLIYIDPDKQFAHIADFIEKIEHVPNRQLGEKLLLAHLKCAQDDFDKLLYQLIFYEAFPNNELLLKCLDDFIKQHRDHCLLALYHRAIISLKNGDYASALVDYDAALMCKTDTSYQAYAGELLVCKCFVSIKLGHKNSESIINLIPAGVLWFLIITSIIKKISCVLIKHSKIITIVVIHKPPLREAFFMELRCRHLRLKK
jgi:tetratricopeptide (TPR) repeat protein